MPREETDQLKDELAYDQRLAPVQAESNRRQEALRLAQLPQIAAEMATLKESLSVTRSKLDSLVLKAPVAGKLTEDELQVGQILKPGDRRGRGGAGQRLQGAGRHRRILPRPRRHRADAPTSRSTARAIRWSSPGSTRR